MQVTDFLPVAAPAWSHLRDLTLRGMGFNDFPEDLASAMGRLTHLNLSDNDFERLPTAVKRLSSLEHLELHENKALQVEKEDVATLEALPHLHTLNISKAFTTFSHAKVDYWSERSVGAFIAITKRLPLLKLPHLSEE